MNHYHSLLMLCIIPAIFQCSQRSEAFELLIQEDLTDYYESSKTLHSTTEYNTDDSAIYHTDSDCEDEISITKLYADKEDSFSAYILDEYKASMNVLSDDEDDSLPETEIYISEDNPSMLIDQEILATTKSTHHAKHFIIQQQKEKKACLNNKSLYWIKKQTAHLPIHDTKKELRNKKKAKKIHKFLCKQPKHELIQEKKCTQFNTYSKKANAAFELYKKHLAIPSFD